MTETRRRALADQDLLHSSESASNSQERLLQNLDALYSSQVPLIVDAISNFLANLSIIDPSQKDVTTDENLQNSSQSSIQSSNTNSTGTLTSTHSASATLTPFSSYSNQSLQEEQTSTITHVNKSEPVHGQPGQQQAKQLPKLSNTMWTGCRDKKLANAWVFNKAPISTTQIDAFVLERAPQLLDMLSDLDPATARALGDHVDNLQETLLAIHIRRQRRYRLRRGSAISSLKFVTGKDAAEADLVDRVPPKSQGTRPRSHVRRDSPTAAAGLVDHLRSKSRGRRSRSHVRLDSPIAAAGLGGAALARLYENRKAKQMGKGERELSGSRSQSRSRGHTHSSSTSTSVECGAIQYDSIQTCHRESNPEKQHYAMQQQAQQAQQAQRAQQLSCRPSSHPEEIKDAPDDPERSTSPTRRRDIRRLYQEFWVGWRQYWYQSSQMHFLVACCCIGAAIQGWDEPAVSRGKSFSAVTISPLLT